MFGLLPNDGPRNHGGHRAKVTLSIAVLFLGFGCASVEKDLVSDRTVRLEEAPNETARLSRVRVYQDDGDLIVYGKIGRQAGVKGRVEAMVRVIIRYPDGCILEETRRAFPPSLPIRRSRKSNFTVRFAGLRAAGIEHIVILTGDNKGTAEAIGREAGMDKVKAEMLPEDKVRAVEELVAQYQQVAMIGDGVNDAPAMARSTVGIAMGAAGTDAAIETADIALMSDDLSKVPWLIRHSRRTLRIIRVNITASLLVKVAFVGLTFLGKASLWAAIAADTGVSLLVVLNALRLLGGAPSKTTSAESNSRGLVLAEPAQ